MTTLAQEYTTKWRPIITPIAQKYGINPDFALAQMAQESWWGTKTPAGSHNYAGIQDFRKKSDGVMASDAGRQRKFRKFANEQAFAEHYLNMLSRLYPGTKTAKTIDEFTSALQDGKRRYAESDKYKQHVGEVYRQHFANGQDVGQAKPSAGGTSYQTQGGVSTTTVNGNTFQMSVPKPPPAVAKDPYEDLWNVKTPAATSETEYAPRLVSGSSSPYKAGSYKFNWGI